MKCKWILNKQSDLSLSTDNSSTNRQNKVQNMLMLCLALGLYYGIEHQFSTDYCFGFKVILSVQCNCIHIHYTLSWFNLNTTFKEMKRLLMTLQSIREVKDCIFELNIGCLCAQCNSRKYIQHTTSRLLLTIWNSKCVNKQQHHCVYCMIFWNMNIWTLLHRLISVYLFSLIQIENWICVQWLFSLVQNWRIVFGFGI